MSGYSNSSYSIGGQQPAIEDFSVEGEPLASHQLAVVEAWLNAAGWSFPRDAIVAVREGRTHYHPIDPSITYPMTVDRRRPIARAIQRAACEGWNRPQLA